MKIYLVREIGTTKIHGIFWADNLEVLEDAILEMGPSFPFEFSEISNPGGIWHDTPLEGTPSTTQYDPEFVSETDFYMAALSSTGEHLLHQICQQHEYSWEAVAPHEADEWLKEKAERARHG